MAVGNNISNLYKTTVNGTTFTVNPASAGGYLSAYGQYETDRTNQLNATRQQLDNTLQQNNATTNANYDNSARQAYVQYMQRQRALPSQLQALGVNGGATESGLLNLYNNYGASHAANEQQRNADLTTNRQNRDDAYNSAYQAYLSDLNEQKQQAIANQINEYNNEVTRFSSSVAQYPTTEKGYQKYEKWIENMKNSSDPLKDIKVALIRQQMASQFPNGKPASSSSSSSSGSKSSGSRRRSYSSGYSNSSNNSSSTPTNVAAKATSGLLAYDAARRAVKAASALSKTKKKTTSSSLNRTPQNSYWK